MAEKSNVFPTIIRAEYDPANAFPKMIADAKGAAGQIKGEFSKALGTGLTVSGTKGVFDGLAAEASRLRSAIDPLYSAQTKFNQAMNSAETLARAGVITNSELTQATRLYGAELQRANAALFENAKASNAARSAASSPIRQKSGAEILVSGGATIDRAALSLATLESVLGRVSKEGANSRNAMDDVSEAAKRLNANLSSIGNANSEISNRKFQEYESLALGIGRAGSSARDSASAFQVLFDAEDRAADKARELASNLALINAANADVANRKFQDFEQLSVGIGRAGTSARESASAFQALFDAEDRAADGAKKLAIEQDRLASEAAKLRAQLDPLYTAQVRFDQEMSRADDLLRAGAIGQREYAQATQAARDALQQANAAIHQTADAAKQGTTANHLMVNSTRSLRQASVQAGQQMQDVAISLYSGQNASVVFAQQLPQLAFALSGLEGSANKTHNRIGQFATFLSGPWGLAVGLGIGVLAQLVTSLISSGEEADKTGSAVARLGNKLDISKNSYRALIDVVKEYNAAQRESEALTYSALRAAEAEAEANLKLAKAKLAAARATALNSNGKAAAGYFGGQSDVLAAKVAQLEKELTAARIGGETERAKRSTDPRYAIAVEYDEKIAKLQAAAEKNLINSKLFGKALIDLTNAKTKALNDFDEAQKKTSTTTKRRSRAEVLRDFKSELSSRGIRVISDVRSAAKQNSLFQQGLTPLDGYKRASRHQTAQAVDVDKRTHSDAAAYAAAQAAGLKGFKIVTESGGRKHYEWKAAGEKGLADVAGGEKFANALEKAAEQAQRLSEFGQDAGDRIASIANNFDETPPAVARANEALARMADLSTDIDKKLKEGLDPKVAEALKASIVGLEPIIRDSVAQPIRDMLDDTEKNVAVLDLLIAGREIEAEVLRRKYQLETNTRALTEGEVGQIRDSLTLEREKTRELEKQNGIRQREVALLDETQNNLKQLTFDVLKGNSVKGIGAALSRQFDAMLSNMADNLSESLFGDFFRDAKDKALGFDKVKDASVDVSKGLDKATVAANDFATALGQTIADIRADALGENGVASNDNDGEIVVIGKLEPKTPSEIRREKSLTTSALTTALGDRFGKTVQSAVQNGFTGALVGGLIGGKTGRAVGGGLSSLATLAASAGGQGGKLDSFFQALNQASPVIAATMAINDIANSVLGNDQIKGGNTWGKISPLFTALFGKARKGSATIGGVGSSLGITGVTGNSSSRKQAASDSANSIIGIIEGIADSFAGAFNASAGSVSIGVRKKSYVLDPTGQGRTKGAGTINFGSDQEAAMRAAVLDLIRDGVISGLRAGTQTLIQATGDLEKQLQKAAKFEGVFASLKAIKDPVGSALETLNKEFTSLIGVFKEAGATTAEWAQLEEYYGLKREEVIKQTTDALTSALKNLLSDLEIGDNGLSLNDRLANARTVYDPLAAKIRNGETVNYDAFAEAARSVIDISRQIYGSQDDYFAMFNEVTGLTRKALSDQQNIISIASGTASPFASTATPSLDNTPVVAAIDGQSQMLLTQLLGLNTTNGKILNAIEAANNNGTGSALFNGVFGLQANTYF